jgi:hypothetical protein
MGTLMVSSRYNHSQITVCSRHAHGQLRVRENILGLYLDASLHTNDHSHVTVGSRERIAEPEVHELPEDGTFVPKHVAVGI